jgi:hypothetical protein
LRIRKHSILIVYPVIHLKEKTPAAYLGLPPAGMNAFSMLIEGRETAKPKRKPGPKYYRTREFQAMVAIETPEERKARHLKTRTDKVLRQNKDQFVPNDRAARDRNAAISGKSVFLGTRP